MSIDEERLLAWVDGALSDSDAAEVAAAVAADPALAALAASHRQMAERLRGGFDTLLHEPIPAALAAAARPVAPGASATVTDLAAARAARQSPPARRFQLPQWAAIAATLAIGIVAGRMTGEIGPQPIVTQAATGLQASGRLAAALDSQLASAPSSATGNDAVRVQVTFRSRDGQVCRSWSAAGQDGVACHAGDRWRIIASLAAPTADSTEYRMAGSADPKLLGLIDGMIEGEPFDAARERTAQRNGWR